VRIALILIASLLAVTPIQARPARHQPSPRPERVLPSINLNTDGTFFGIVRPTADKDPLLGGPAVTDWTNTSAQSPTGAHFMATITAHDPTHTLMARDGLAGADILGDNSSSAPQGRQAKIMLVLPTEQ
jgi:hypothetical protein